MNIRNLSGYAEAADRTLKGLLAHPVIGPELRKKDRLGGYFCIADGETGRPLLIVLIGELQPERMDKCLELVQEKALRLAAVPGHRLSRDSADATLGLYPGAVRGRTLIASFSGIPADLDEIISARALQSQDELTEGEVIDLVAVNDNGQMLGLDYFRTAA